MAFKLPVFAEVPLYEYRVRLDARDYRFRFDWNNREETWFLNIKDIDGRSLLAGVRVVANWDLLVRSRANALLPQGRLLAIDLETDGVRPGFRDFGSRVVLWYFGPDEDLTEFEI